jgi:excisionase family DNA binding protein
MLTMEEAAAQARVSPRTVRRWAREGIMPAKQLGGTWRIAPEALQKFLGRDDQAEPVQ